MHTVAARWPTLAETPALPVHERISAPHAPRRTAALLEDAALAILVAYVVPVIILLVGTPLALFVRGILEVARRFS